ncbi:Sugar transferase involved in LPS biosynthesis (colanic, teichoic acid) [Micromonospora chokoriensis]|uniref:Sugar transferase involved in LPS biosynthesis (Colanic, teichoic acid) n=1 Tax=Micromonospora chokoriensis TaxID=356851 RepID=A0A1C4XT68_9ACTN|nr:Sugar transferase involved in LPS biosynthesis (colanic, teichoic acid) [Micromonospora chokoriensis]
MRETSRPVTAGTSVGLSTDSPTIPVRFHEPVGRPVRTSRADQNRRRERVVVLEPNDTATTPDRLDEEFDVAARLPVPGCPDELARLLGRVRPRLLLLKHSLESIDDRIITRCLSADVEIMVLARPVYGLLRAPAMARFGGLPWIRLRSGVGRPRGERLKRFFDLSMVLLSAVLVIPLITMIAAVVSFTGPPFYLQQRVGAGGRLFRVVKFRTMRVGAEQSTGPVLAQPNDARITRVGRWLRRSRLDELPQLWNVVRGDMSLVGPRPERPEFIVDFRQLPHYDLRHLIRPGLTGIAQLTGGYAATVEDKLRCDLLYLNCRSMRVDLTLLLLTVVELFRGFPRG